MARRKTKESKEEKEKISMKKWKWKVSRIPVLLGLMMMLSSLTAWAGLEVSKDNFPDPQFRAIISTFDKDNNGWLYPEEFEAITEIDCKKNQNLKDVTGIESLPELKRLDCWGCPLTKLDTSDNKKLEYLDICETGLSASNLKLNPNIRKLWAYGNKITSLDLSNSYYLAKAVKNGGKDSTMKGGFAVRIYEDSETGSKLVVDKAVKITGADKATTIPTEDNSSDTGMGGFASPQEGADYFVGTPVLIDIRPTGSVSIGGISYSGTCEIKNGYTVVYSKDLSESGFEFEFTPDSPGMYSVSVELNYYLSGNLVDTSSHTRTFRVIDIDGTTVSDTSKDDNSDDLAHAEDSQSAEGSETETDKKTETKTATVKLSKTKLTYNGKAQKPGLTVVDGKKKLTTSSYSVTWPKSVNPGEYTVTVKLKNGYKGTKKAKYTIIPKGTALGKLKAGKKKLTVKWKKQPKQITGYEISYSIDKSFKKEKIVTE